MTSITIDDFPDELLDIICDHATSCESSSDQDISIALQTRISILMVCRRWQAVGECYLYRDIYINSKGETKLHQLLCRVTELVQNQPRRVSGIQSLNVSYPDPSTTSAVDRAGTHFSVLLSHVVLRRLVTNFGSRAPWLRMLAFKSGSYLTHLEFRFPWTRDISDIIPHINKFVNLIFLSIVDTATPREVQEGRWSLKNDPELSLPRLQKLRLRTVADEEILSPDENGLILLGILADLPALHTLDLCADWTGGRVNEIFENLGAGLHHLVAETAYIYIIEELHEVCPCITDLTFRMSAGSGDDFCFNLAHPTLRRLVVPPSAVNEVLRRLDRSAVPSLEYVKFEGTYWKDLLALTSGQAHTENDAYDDIQTAIELAMKGIPLLDEDGQLLGGVTLATV